MRTRHCSKFFTFLDSFNEHLWDITTIFSFYRQRNRVIELTSFLRSCGLKWQNWGLNTDTVGTNLPVGSFMESVSFLHGQIAQGVRSIFVPIMHPGLIYRVEWGLAGAWGLLLSELWSSKSTSHVLSHPSFFSLKFYVSGTRYWISISQINMY